MLALLNHPLGLNKTIFSPKFPCFVLYMLAGLLIACGPGTKPTETSGPEPMDAYCMNKLTDLAWYGSNTPAPILPGLSNPEFAVTTSSALAQKYFDQGFVLSFGFNHAEAARSFYEVTRQDSNCAMGYWGFAYVLGPNYNAGMEPDNFERAHTAAQKAKSLSGNCTPLEKDLIDALTYRYSAAPDQNRAEYDSAYSSRMKLVYDKYPGNGHLAALYAESIMDLHPWDLWEKNGEPKPWTPQILEILENNLGKHPRHAGLNHLYIHAIEASRAPEKGLPSARILGSLNPGAGHLVHMPSHIFIRTGHYREGSEANIRAIKADSGYFTACHAQGAYPLAYYPHNIHFLATTATLAGEKERALWAADQLNQATDKEIMRLEAMSTLQHYYIIPYHTALKFGQWREILQMKNYYTDLPYLEAIRHYARGWAYLRLNKPEHAKLEWIALKKAMKEPVIEGMTVWGLNPMSTLLEIAQRDLHAALLAHYGQEQRAVQLLLESVALEDGLNYDEPPDWLFSQRHHLGTLYLQIGSADKAEAIFIEDLQTLRENGWALHGLFTAQEMQGKKAEAALTRSRFKRAWAGEVPLFGAMVQ